MIMATCMPLQAEYAVEICRQKVGKVLFGVFVLNAVCQYFWTKNASDTIKYKCRRHFSLRNAGVQ